MFWMKSISQDCYPNLLPGRQTCFNEDSGGLNYAINNASELKVKFQNIKLLKKLLKCALQIYCKY